MKTILIDLNVLLDWLGKREGYEDALAIMVLCTEKIVKAYVCAHEITTLSYFLEKNKKKKEELIAIISLVMKLCEIVPTDRQILERALAGMPDDFEDAVVAESAGIVGVNCIVTKNVKDFKNSLVQVLTPKLLLEKINCNKKQGGS